MDLDAHQQLMDACCLWLYVRQQLKNELSAEYMLKMDDMWTNGPLGWELGVCVCVWEGDGVHHVFLVCNMQKMGSQGV